jgi:hypothetical protein
MSEDEDRRRYIQGELDAVLPSTHDGRFKIKILGLGESKWLNITADQYAAIGKIILPEAPSPVSYAPCITGHVEIEGAVSEFMIPLDNDSVGFSQWGAPNEVLWARVELLNNLSGPAREWWSENRPEDDGEEGCDSFIADGSEFCARCNKPAEAHYA